MVFDEVREKWDSTVSRPLAMGIGIAISLGVTVAGAEQPPLEMMRRAVLGEREVPPAIFTVAAVEGPESAFRTVILSGTELMIFGQYRTEGPPTVAGVDGGGGWGYDVSKGEIESLGEPSVAFLHAHDLHRIVLNPLQYYVLAAQPSCEGSPCVVRLRDEGGRGIELRIDRDSGLPLELLLPNHRTGGRVRVRFHDWREVDGRRLFHAADVIDGEDMYAHTYERIDPDLDPPLAPVGEGDVSVLARHHHLDQFAHFARDAALLVSHLADPLVEISRGVVSTIERDQAMQRFQSYFDRAVFEQWADVAPALIEVDAEAGHAHKVVQKRVRLKGSSENVRFAWLESWSRVDGRWTLSTMVSTRQEARGRD